MNKLGLLTIILTILVTNAFSRTGSISGRIELVEGSTRPPLVNATVEILQIDISE